MGRHEGLGRHNLVVFNFRRFDRNNVIEFIFGFNIA
jgi:hypothetical protein